jgi:transposase-like protein
MKTNLSKLQCNRVFSEEIKRQAVNEYEKGKLTVGEISKFYHVSTTAVYKWLKKYSNFERHTIHVVEMSKSNTQKIKDLENRIKELEQAVGNKQMNIDFLEKMIEIAKDRYGIDIKKNFGTQQSTGSGKTKQH